MGPLKVVIDTASKVVKQAGTVVVLVSAAVKTYNDLRKVTSKKVERRPWGKKHLWQYFTAGVQSTDKPWCFNCKIEQTPENEHEICAGPPGWRP